LPAISALSVAISSLGGIGDVEEVPTQLGYLICACRARHAAEIFTARCDIRAPDVVSGA
jgi:hypothetical protein